MFSGELQARARRFDKHAAGEAEKLKRKAEKDKILKQRAAERARKHEELAQARQRAEREAAEQAELAREAAMEANRGVAYTEVLRATIQDEAVAADKGIRRAADKLLLPKAMGDELMMQNAPKNGAMLFEVESLATGRKTHAGVLEFSAMPGTAALPRKVLRSLFGDEGRPLGDVRVSYRLLQKGAHVELRPRERAFHESVGDVAEELLEAALMRCTALTEGDVIEVDVGGVRHDLTVQALQPEAAVCVIDTEMSAHVVSSEETDNAIEAAEEEQRRIAETLRREQERQAREAAEERAREEQDAQLRMQEAAAAAEAAEAVRQRAEAALPPEPPADCGEPCAVCMVRLPSGVRATRRIPHTAPLSQLFTWVDSLPRGGADATASATSATTNTCSPGTYALVTQYPRRTFTPSMQGSLAEVGLNAPQESFLLEALAVGSQ